MGEPQSFQCAGDLIGRTATVHGEQSFFGTLSQASARRPRVFEDHDHRPSRRVAGGTFKTLSLSLQKPLVSSDG